MKVSREGEIERLRESESKLKAIFENASDIFLYVDLSGKIVEVNDRIKDLMGYRPEDVIGKNFAQIGVLHVRYMPSPAKLFASVMRKGRVVGGGSANVTEIMLRRKDGTEIPMEVITTLVRSGEKVTGALSVMRDITERRKVEEEIRKSEERYKIATAQTGQLIYDYDMKSGVIRWVGAIREISGCGAEEFQKTDIRGWEQMIHPDDRKKALSLLAESRRKGSRYYAEYRFRRKDGSYIYVEDVGVFLKRDGKPYRMIGTIKDIAERRKAEEEIRKERDRVRKYMEIAGVMFVALDTEGRVTLINRKGCEVLGYRQSEIAGKDWFGNFIPEEKRSEVRDAFKEIVSGKTGGLEHIETPVMTKNGKERLIAWNNIVLKDEKGNITGILSSGEDITEKKVSEEGLKKRTEESEKFARLSVGRELRMIKLKKRIKELENRLKDAGIEEEGGEE
jgi:PAS domain S-box-containing protein